MQPTEEAPMEAVARELPRIRSKQVTWEDPMALAEEALGMSGLEFLRSMIEGRLPRPPIASLLGFTLVDVGEGWAVFEGEVGEEHYNPIGVVHGGLSGMLADSAMGCAVQSTLPAGSGYTTLEFKVNLVRPITAETRLIRCRAEIVHVGRRTGTAEARVTDPNGRLLAHATTTCLILRPEE
jgi:uncharacterized protein (TIGR00369 family)